MIDREKVIKGLECCLVSYEDRLLYQCDDCPYRATEDERKVIDWCCHLEELRRDALELLKEQEPIAPKLIKMYPHDIYECGNCKHKSVGSKDYKAKYCPECGRKLKWE